MIKNNHLQLFLLLLVICFSTACTSYKKVPYLQTEGNSKAPIELIRNSVDEVRFQAEDVLNIFVNMSKEPVVVSSFNLPLHPTGTPEGIGSNGVLDVGVGIQNFLVNSEGYIDFPILGAINVKGMTYKELENFLKESLRPYVKEEPIVTVRLMNFQISVLGEVNVPGQYRVTRDRVNIFEALAMAGDMSVYGKRENVKVMREGEDGNLNIVSLDLSSATVLSSPYFYLQQNDILYIEPNKAKAKSSSIGAQSGILISLVSLLMTTVTLLLTISE